MEIRGKLADWIEAHAGIMKEESGILPTTFCWDVSVKHVAQVIQEAIDDDYTSMEYMARSLEMNLEDLEAFLKDDDDEQERPVQ